MLLRCRRPRVPRSSDSLKLLNKRRGIASSSWMSESCLINKNLSIIFWVKWRNTCKFTLFLWRKALINKNPWLFNQMKATMMSKAWNRRDRSSLGLTYKSLRTPLCSKDTKNTSNSRTTKPAKKCNIITISNGFGCNFLGSAKQSSTFTRPCLRSAFLVLFTLCLHSNSLAWFGM